jgi:hypothetical protein
MERIHRLLSATVRGARWGVPSIGPPVLSTSLASAVTFALASTPARGPDLSTSPTLTTATAALADGDDGPGQLPGRADRSSWQAPATQPPREQRRL